MHKGPLIVLAATTLFGGCGINGAPTSPSVVSLTAALLSGPSLAQQQLPSLDGRWRATGSSEFRNLANGTVLRWGGCSGSLTIAQDGQRFTGPLTTQGGGFNSDRFCTASATLTGELAAGDANRAKARLDGNFQNWPRPSVTPSCEVIAAGDGVWSGSAADDAIQLQVRDTLRCAANVDGGIVGIATADFERTVSLTFQRW